MPHRTSKTFEDYESEAGNIARRQIEVHNQGLEFYNEFQRDLDGRTLVQFAIDINKLEESGTAQAGAASTITLASAASTDDDEYNFLDIAIVAGTGAGQERTISDYVGSTRVATVSAAWATTPDATSQYKIAARAIHEINAVHGASLEAHKFASNDTHNELDAYFAWRALS